jgi:membrane protein DedA with SNARE-associated domain
MRTLFEEGFGVLGGALGTKLGMGAGIGIAVVLGLGPIGLFLAVFVCATAGGILLYEGGKWAGGSIVYDGGSQLINSCYNSIDHFLESCGL